MQRIGPIPPPGRRDSRHRRRFDCPLGHRASRSLATPPCEDAAEARRGAGSPDRRSAVWRSARSGCHRQLVIGLHAHRTTRSVPSSPTSPPPPRLAALEFRPVHVRRRPLPRRRRAHLARVSPRDERVLVLTAAEDADNAFHGNTLWLVANGETRVGHSYGTFEVAMKAAGWPCSGSKRRATSPRSSFLITYDNDPHATRILRRFQTAKLVHPRD